MTEEKIIEHLVTSDEKKYRGCRGPDKSPRKININSLHNLKPFQSVSDVSDLDKLIKNPPDTQVSHGKLWIVFFILLGIVIGYFVWKHYKEKTRESYMSSLSDKLEGGKSNG